MSIAETLDSSASPAPLPFDRRRPVVGPASATAAVDEQARSDAEAAEQARLAAIEVEAELERQRLAELQDHEDDRRALAFNIVAATEFQKGRAVLSRKGAATADLIKRLLDALHADDAPVTYPQFAKGALGGRSALPLARLRELATAPSPRPGGEKVSAQPTDEGRRDAGDDGAAAAAPPAPQAA